MPKSAYAIAYADLDLHCLYVCKDTFSQCSCRLQNVTKYSMRMNVLTSLIFCIIFSLHPTQNSIMTLNKNMQIVFFHIKHLTKVSHYALR